MMQNPNQQENMQGSQNMPPQQNEGAHSLLEVHESVGSLIGSLEQLLLYEEHIQDQELQTIPQKHRAFLSQLYNTIVDTLRQDKTLKFQHRLIKWTKIMMLFMACSLQHQSHQASPLMKLMMSVSQALCWAT